MFLGFSVCTHVDVPGTGRSVPVLGQPLVGLVGQQRVLGGHGPHPGPAHVLVGPQHAGLLQQNRGDQSGGDQSGGDEEYLGDIF